MLCFNKQRALVPLYARQAHIFVLVFDVTHGDYLENLEPFVDIACDNWNEETITAVFCGNKMDLADPSFDKSGVMVNLSVFFGDKLRNMRFVFTSALTGEGIDTILPTIFEDTDVSYNFNCNDNDNTNK